MRLNAEWRVLVVAYAIWLILGLVWMVALAPAAPAYVAARTLAPGHRIVASDLQLVPPTAGRLRLPDRSQLLGKYARAAIGKGAPIEPDGVQDHAVVTAAPDTIVDWISLAPGTADFFNVGDRVDVLTPGEQLGQNLTIRGVVCVGATPCMVAVELPFGHRGLSSKETIRVARRY